ncbi:hypothetical protein ABZ485_24755 [Streptomyces albogriseolus]|uniref:hypothetical protein n=1 Tax=Streptomyces albogriseolus TaxID=1887 RepID=UPI00345F929B
MTAASLAEVIEIRDCGDLAEGALREWKESDGAAEMTGQEFESTWAAARETLDADRIEETS